MVGARRNSFEALQEKTSCSESPMPSTLVQKVENCNKLRRGLFQDASFAGDFARFNVDVLRGVVCFRIANVGSNFWDVHKANDSFSQQFGVRHKFS